MVGFYERRILPSLLEMAMSQKPVMRQRRKLVPAAEGLVLEVGFGSGLNLPYYDASKVREVWALEPSDGMKAKAQARIAAASIPVRAMGLDGQAIPLEDHSVDTVLFTYTLCTIPDPALALREMRRVLKPGGRLLFCEHGLAPDAGVRAWQHRLEPLWKVIGGGCHLTRPTPALLEAQGFVLERLETGYLPGPRPLTFNYLGAARMA